MLCPKCNQQPITFFAFVSKFNQTKIKCQHCQANLKGNKLLHTLFYSALVFGLLLGLSIAILEDIYKWGFGNSIIVFFVIVAVVGMPAEAFAWKHGSYDLNENNDEDIKSEAENIPIDTQSTS